MDNTVQVPCMNWESQNLPEQWKKFETHVQLMFSGPLAGKSEIVKISYLLIWVGEKGRDIRSTWTLTDAEAKLLKTYYDKYKAHVTPQSNEVFARYKFHARVQSNGESFESFVTDLKLLVQDCAYNDADKMIRDRIVFGVTSSTIREKLINKGNALTLEKAIEIAQTHKASKQQLKTIEAKQDDVHALKKRPTHRTKQTQRSQDRDHKRRNEATTERRPTRRNTPECGRCGYSHTKQKPCPAMRQECHKCGKLNHFASVCRAKETIHTIQDNSDDSEDSQDEFHIGEVTTQKAENEVFVPVKVWEVGNKKKEIHFKLDTGAQVNVIPHKLWKKMNCKMSVQKTNTKLTSYSGDTLEVKGVCTMSIQYKAASQREEFYIVNTKSPPVLGLEACTKLGVIKLVLSVKNEGPTNFFTEFKDVFQGLGKFEGQHHIHVDRNYPPVVHPPRRLPHALKKRVKAELDRMEKLGVVKKTDEPTEWVNSMVVVEKPNSNNLRICLDPKDLNKAIKRQHYRTRTLEDITPKLTGAKFFGKCDARSGYWTIKLDEESSFLTTFNTAFGRYRFLRLPFGLVSSQDIFQQKIDQAFEGLEGIEPVADDILVWGSTKQEYEERQRAMLQRAREKGIKLNKEKCQFQLTEVKFFGHILSRDGVKADPEKIAAIEGMPKPENKTELETFLGMINYLSKFAPQLSEITAPLRAMTKQNSVYTWNATIDRVFHEVKEVITKAPVLAYYDAAKDIMLQTDASKNGLGATLLQNGRPIAYASKSLNESQRAYAQIEKELLAIVFGCEKFHEYLYGRQVTVESDHKPIEAIMKKCLALAPPRLQRMLLRLQKYDITVIHKPGKEIPLADVLSRKYLSIMDKPDKHLEAQVHATVRNLPISDGKLASVQQETLKDSQLQQLTTVINEGWPEHRHECPAHVREYWTVKEDLSVINDIVFKGERIVLPKSLRSEMLNKIHTGHMGMEKCKERARMLFYWPHINMHIENMVSKCLVCQNYRRSNCKEPLIPHKIPSTPWEKVATDLFTLHNEDYIVVVDYYSRFFEFEKLNSITSKAVINKMKRIFATHGIPRETISDNGRQFVSEEFKSFALSYGFQHTTSSPRHPQCNGLAEKTVGIVKNMLKKCKDSKQDIYLALLEYRNTPLDRLGSPSQLLMSRELRSILPVRTKQLQPHVIKQTAVKSKLIGKQSRQKKFYDASAKPLKPLKTNQNVRMQQMDGTWIPAKVQHYHGNQSYTVKTKEGHVYRRNRVKLNPSKESLETAPIYEEATTDEQQTLQTKDKCEDQVVQTHSGRTSKPPERWSPC